MIDDATFEREKLRREAQDFLNELDILNTAHAEEADETTITKASVTCSMKSILLAMSLDKFTRDTTARFTQAKADQEAEPDA